MVLEANNNFTLELNSLLRRRFKNHAPSVGNFQNCFQKMIYGHL